MDKCHSNESESHIIFKVLLILCMNAVTLSIFYFLEFIMSNQPSPQKDSNEETVLGWKFVIIVGVLSTIFLSFFYLAMSQEPDYMPGAQRKAQQQKELSQAASPASSDVTTQDHHHQ